MAVKGSIAKQAVQKKIEEVFGKDFVGIYSGKTYVWADDGGERVQIAIALTCPKVEVGPVGSTPGAGNDFTIPTEPLAAPSAFEPAQVTEEEQQNIADMLKALGL